MSRGPGRVQQSVLERLNAGLRDVALLALYAHASPESTRRALRTLRRAERVQFLGFAGRGVGMWCLPEDEVQARAALLPDDLAEQITRLMGARVTRRLTRSYLSMP